MTGSLHLLRVHIKFLVLVAYLLHYNVPPQEERRQKQQALELDVRAHAMKECTFRPATSAAATRAIIARLLADDPDEYPMPCLSYELQAAGSR